MIVVLACALSSYAACVMFYKDGEHMEALTMLTVAFLFATIPYMAA